MALDKAPRKFTLHITEVGILLNTIESDEDYVILKFHGKLLPSTKERITKALSNAEYVITEEHLA